MKSLSLLDLIFFAVESEDSPKHVAGLLRCRKPAGCSANYARALVAELKTHERLVEPFNLVINFLGLKGPHWERCREFSIDQHIFYHRPQKQISWQQTLAFAADLHQPLMDRSKPLWEFHLIDGIKGGKFAIYIKLHHAYADGMTMTTWFQRSFNTSPEDLNLHPIWEMRPRKRKQLKKSTPSLLSTARNLGGQALGQLRSVGGIAKLNLQQTIERSGLTRDAVALLFSTAHDTPLTGRASPGRFLATSSLPMEEVTGLCRRKRCTLNHLALTCIDGAMHQYLASCGIELDHPVTIQMPVSLRKNGDSSSGNKLGIALLDLAQPGDDPLERHREIGYKLRNVKNQVAGVPGDSFEQYTILVAGVSELIEKLQLTNRLPSNGHTIVSNVPGPTETLYLKGSVVERMYPISTLAPGLRMNITLFSYAGVLHFGIVATRNMENLQILADNIIAEFRNLESLQATAKL